MFLIRIEQFVQEARRKISGLPNRIKYALGVASFVGFWLLLLDTPPLEPERGRRRSFKPQPPPSLPGGDWQSFQQIFAFGDSWSTTQFSVYGDQPNEANPFGNPQIPKNGTTGPPNWLQFLTLTHNASFIRTYIIAEGAATIDREVVPPHEFLSWTHTFKEQVGDIFAPNYISQAPLASWDPQHTLFAVWFGVVDIALLVDRKDPDKDINAHNIAAYAEAIHKLYELGARHFLLLTIPPMYISPSAREQGHDPTLERKLILDFNDRVLDVRKELVTIHPDATAYVFDVHGLLTEAISSPENVIGTEHLQNTTENCWKYNPLVEESIKTRTVSASSPQPDAAYYHVMILFGADYEMGFQSDAYKEPHPWDWYEPECGIPLDQYFWANPLHPTHAAHNATAAAIVEGCMGAFRSGFCS